MIKDNLAISKGKALIQAVLAAVYPPQCLSCNNLMGSDHGLCAQCWRQTPFLMPPICEKCGASVLGQADDDDLECEECHIFPPPWRMGRAALEYKDNTRRLVLGFKHADRLDLAAPAAKWMAAAGMDMLHPRVVLVPIPLHWRRLFQRRYNQAAVLAYEISRLGGYRYIPDLLERRRPTGSQEGRNRDERFAKMAHAFSLNHRYKDQIKGQEIILVDDVMTSGATFWNATLTCYAAGAKSVDILSFARVAKSF